MKVPRGYTVYFDDGGVKVVNTFTELVRLINGPRGVYKIYKGTSDLSFYLLYGPDIEYAHGDSQIEVIDSRWLHEK